MPHGAMVMDGLEMPLPAHLLLAEPPPHVLGFDCLYKAAGSIASPPAEPPDLHTPVTTAQDAPSFFGPGSLDQLGQLSVEPPPITGENHENSTQ